MISRLQSWTFRMGGHCEALCKVCFILVGVVGLFFSVNVVNGVFRILFSVWYGVDGLVLYVCFGLRSYMFGLDGCYWALVCMFIRSGCCGA